MEEKFELVRKNLNEKIDVLMHKLDTIYTPVKREKRVLKTVEAAPVEDAPVMDKNEELRLRHQQQEEELKNREEN